MYCYLLAANNGFDVNISLFRVLGKYMNPHNSTQAPAIFVINAVDTIGFVADQIILNQMYLILQILVEI